MVSNETLLKLKTLAERGCEGEKENASNLLEKLCIKYGVSLDEIESEQVKFHWFKFNGQPIFKTLLHQCMYKATGNPDLRIFRRGKERLYIGAECTAAQAVEIELDYEFYSHHLKSETERLVSAFIQVNKIFPPNAPIDNISDVNSKDEYLQMSIERRTRTKLIGG